MISEQEKIYQEMKYKDYDKKDLLENMIISINELLNDENLDERTKDKLNEILNQIIDMLATIDKLMRERQYINLYKNIFKNVFFLSLCTPLFSMKSRTNIRLEYVHSITKIFNTILLFNEEADVFFSFLDFFNDLILNINSSTDSSGSSEQLVDFEFYIDNYVKEEPQEYKKPKKRPKP
jgi:hypothetical protein